MHPVLIRIGSFELRTYGVAIALGLLIGLAWSRREFQQRDLPVDFIGIATLVVVPTGIICARILYVALNWNEYTNAPLNALNLRAGGLSLFGALIGGITSLALVCKLHGINFWEVGDALSQGYILAYALGRVGCLFNGCCIGYPTDLPWAMRFLTEEGTMTPPSHPVPLYEIAGALLVFIILRKLHRVRSFSGQEMIVTLILHLLLRFANEFFRRGISAKVIVIGLTQAQLACIVGIIILAWLYWHRKVKGCVAITDTRSY
ncbi:MAG: prolipoprotein diacylglyceryl transferase [Armatimonadota bacterium]|nr:prolipoprotein diacylglyceryl transferase [Armatimonadota bacterium]MCX7777360.1 prolipoprotein diacylglyceryl transferase [Armatimonadota bacterium]MDW8025372.1 prolipoprotein diacylglyceryl transferase [Armatimonadota bacterium]